MHRILAIVLLLGAAARAAEAPDTATSEAGGYGIQPGDVLQISVWNEESMNREALVRPDGGISYPLAGELQVRGLTVGRIQALLAERLAQFFPDPVVNVAVQEIRGNTIYVVGKVNRPGPYVMTAETDVMQALSLAGGTATFAALDDILILRRRDGEQQSIPFDYSDVERGRGLEQNVILEAGDVVVVP